MKVTTGQDLLWELNKIHEIEDAINRLRDAAIETSEQEKIAKLLDDVTTLLDGREISRKDD